ncbi:hypothetical protein ACCAA_350124 [Candidatus Accumulibacter aalborgensis]|uniref:Uncharacterized protein n=1 Tax=Candidatus Accumulibacter aalborgensis TaxID=1860102 RepID=A0A1A8XQN2_9PROT|nr:hypothetical protein [Candidatus Accumulibacter aalborgensis]SBT06752.1 hypothetical protein ACCAA_350124 [Candidatus Accumulibacter aalborgensis]
MTQARSYVLGLKLPTTDFEIIEAIAKEERRRPSDVIRNVIEDVVEGKIHIEPKEEPDNKRTNVRVDGYTIKKVNAFKKATGMTLDQILHLALMNLRSEDNPAPPTT